MSLEMGHFVTGFTYSNQRFRPSDWAERTASVCAYFDKHCRLHYNPMLRPISHAGLRGLYIASELERLNPDAYRFAMDFALGNQLQILDIAAGGELLEVA